MKYRKSAIRELSESSGINISKKTSVEEIEGIVYIDLLPAFFRYDNKLLPTLHLLKNHNNFPSIKIDSGAVKFLIKGADIMRPGITHFDEFIEGDIVTILGPESDMPLGLGISLLSSVIAIKESSGKTIKTIHYVGDSIWNSKVR